MPSYYVDIETQGLDPNKNKIITIQYVELERNSSSMIGDIKILKEWESDEKTILKDFIVNSGIMDDYTFSFIGIGYNLQFEQKFLSTRLKKNGLPPINLLDKPHIDLHNIGILMKNGEFKGSGLDQITNKPHNGRIVLSWYEYGHYDEIINYIRTETESFLDFYGWLLKRMPKLLDEYRSF